MVPGHRLAFNYSLPLLIWVKIINQMKIFYDKCHWQEKSYVTGLEAANRVVDYLEEGSFAKIIPVEEDEPHIEALRILNRRFNEFRDQVPLSNFFLQWTCNWVICYVLEHVLLFHNVYKDATACPFWLALGGVWFTVMLHNAITLHYCNITLM